MDVKLDGDANVVVKKKQSNVDDGMIDYILPVLRLTNGWADDSRNGEPRHQNKVAVSVFYQLVRLRLHTNVGFVKAKDASGYEVVMLRSHKSLRKMGIFIDAGLVVKPTYKEIGRKDKVNEKNRREVFIKGQNTKIFEISKVVDGFYPIDDIQSGKSNTAVVYF